MRQKLKIYLGLDKGVETSKIKDRGNMHKRTIYTQRERDRKRLLKLKQLHKPIQKILEQIKESKVEKK